MRMLVTVVIPTEEGNEAIRDGSIGKTLEQILGDIKPEALYFGPNLGNRALYMVVNITDGSQFPAIAEPFFLAFNATIEAVPVFTQEELVKAMPAIQAIAQKYG